MVAHCEVNTLGSSIKSMSSTQYEFLVISGIAEVTQIPYLRLTQSHLKSQLFYHLGA